MVRTRRRTRKRKGGSPTAAQLKKASTGLTRKTRPPPLKISRSPSPSDRTKNVYNPLSPTHKKILFAEKKKKMIKSPLNKSNQLALIDIFDIPAHIDPNTQYFYIDDDETREIFEFGMNDTKLNPTGFAYIDGKWKNI